MCEAEKLEVGHFFGVNRRVLREAGFVLSETHYAPGLRVPPHEHELAYFCFLVDGGYWETYGRRGVDYRPSSVAFHPAAEGHYGDISRAGGQCFHVEIEKTSAEKAKSYGRLPTDTEDHHGGELVWLASRLYREFSYSAVGSPLIVEGLVLEMLGAVLCERSSGRPRKDSPPSFVRAAVDRLHDEFAKPLTVQEIAADLDVTPVRLSRLFRKCLGESLGDYLRKLRVEHALTRLRASDVNLAELAIECGFSDQSHFNRVFKRLTGSSPGEFRRRVSAGLS